MTGFLDCLQNLCIYVIFLLRYDQAVVCPLVIIAFSIQIVHKSIAIDEGGFSFLKIMAEGSDIFERYYIVKIKKKSIIQLPKQ